MDKWTVSDRAYPHILFTSEFKSILTSQCIEIGHFYIILEGTDGAIVDNAEDSEEVSDAVHLVDDAVDKLQVAESGLSSITAQGTLLSSS